MHHLYRHLMFSAAIGFGGLAALLILARLGGYSDVLMIVFFSGAVGGVVNNYFRLAALSSKPLEASKLGENALIVPQIYLSLAIGGVLACVAYALFAGGFVQGSLFPKFNGLTTDYGSITRLLLDVAPATNIDAAKCVLWAFIAGFSERLVPNMIDRAVSELSKGNG